MSLRLRSLVVLLLLCSFLVPLGAAAQATQTQSLKQQIQSRTDEIKKLEEEVRQYQQQLTSLDGEKRTLQSEITGMEATRRLLNKEIDLATQKISRASAELSQLQLGISKKELTIAQQKQALAQIVRRIHEYDNASVLQAVLGAGSISDFFSEADALARLQEGVADTIAATRKVRNELSEELTAIEKVKGELVSFQSNVKDKRTLVDQQKKEQAVLLAQTKNKESEYKKLLQSKQARIQQFVKEIDAYEAQLKAVIDTTTFPAPGTRVFLSPLENILVTQKFGRTVDARRLYSSGTHNGTDFRAAIGTPVRAVAGGVVEGFGDTDTVCRWASYGRWILLKHRMGISTLYAHLDLIKVQEGQTVEPGDVIGYSGNTGYSTGPHLHFSAFVSSAVQISNLPSKSCAGATFRIPVAAQNAYLDPEAYL